MVSNHKRPELTSMEKKVIYELCGNLSDGARPFADLAAQVGLTEDQVLEVVRSLVQRGCLRRFGATLRHQRSGFTSNAMVAWTVPDNHIDKVGRLLASFPEVTHCYQRRTAPGWPRNLYTMIHGASEAECRRLADKMALTAGLTDYELLFSHEELKKTSMRYFG